jgi:hypothetical protein
MWPMAEFRTFAARWAALSIACVVTGWLAMTPARANELRPAYMEFSQRTASDWALVWRSPMRGAACDPIRSQCCRKAARLSATFSVN